MQQIMYHSGILLIILELLVIIITITSTTTWALDNVQKNDDINEFRCINARIIKRYNLNQQLYRSCDAPLIDSTISQQQQQRQRRAIVPIFKGKPKARAEMLATKFHMDLNSYDQTNSLVALVNKVAEQYLAKCPPVIYYDNSVVKSDAMILETLFKTFPVTFYHGIINERYETINTRFTKRIDNHCKSYILFLTDPSITRDIIGPQVDSRVVVISRSTQWKLRDFLASPKSSDIVNLLVIGESLSEDTLRERPYVLYTHKLYTDGLGSNVPVVLTSWIKGAMSRPHVNLFPPKFQNGFAGHRFQIAAANQPPFIFRINSLNFDGNINVNWDGIEYRLINMISKKLNFSFDVMEPSRSVDTRSIIDDIQLRVMNKHSDIGMSGVYVTEDRIRETDMSVGHSRDCATFITLASKALPKYRAIMGPFQWPVWVAVTCVYLGGIFPIAYTDRLTLSHLIGNLSEIENMFWYVFGMFTNSLTFSGKYSWSNSKKMSTRLLIGSYWLFTIIITACYTGSIIAFVTLPAFPDTVDSVLDLLGLFFRVGTLDNGGWENWFQNSTHVPTSKLYKKMEFVSTIEEGIGNVTQSFFWNYAFLGSKAQLEYLVQSNFSDESVSHRSALHLSEECFALFQIGYIFPRDAVYKRKIDSFIQLALQGGLIDKISNEVKWTMQRSATGKLLQASSTNALRDRIQEERQLTTADTEGMFLLMGIGYLLGAIALVSEIVGGITNKCRQILKRSRKSFSSSFSSKRNSVDDGIERTEEEQLKHNRRRMARRKAADAEKAKQQGFGMREFNLTKTTLKELYGNYHKSEPKYFLKDGKLILETDAISMDSTEDGYSRNSSAETQQLALAKRHLQLRCKRKKLVVAKVDESNAMATRKEDISDISDGDINESLAILDNCLQIHNCKTDNEDISNTEDEIDNDVVIHSGPMLDENESLFGSYVDGDQLVHNIPKIDQLKLFNVTDGPPTIEKK